MNGLLTLGQAAERLGVHVGTLRAWVRNGQIPAYRVGGRFARVAWDELLESIRTSDDTSALSSLPERGCVGRPTECAGGSDLETTADELRPHRLESQGVSHG
jgi:excisionase family DNA binding protein